MTGKHQIRWLWTFDFLADILAVLAAYHTALWLRFDSDWGQHLFCALNRWLNVRETAELGSFLQYFYTDNAPRICLQIIFAVTILYALRNLYSERRRILYHSITWDIVVCNAIALVIFYTYFYLNRNVFHPRSFFAPLIVLNVLYCISFRGFVRHGLQWLRRRFGLDRTNVLLIDSKGKAHPLVEFIEKEQPLGLHVVARHEMEASSAVEPQLDAIVAAANASRADMIISTNESLSVAQIMLLLEKTDRLGLPVKILSDHLRVLAAEARMPVERANGTPLVNFDAPARRPFVDAFRHVAGRLVTAILLVLLVPLYLLIAILIRATSRGPAFFVQERIGVNRKPFRMFKFRTMYDRAEEMQAQVEEFNEAGAGLFKIRKDPRITPVGRILRRFSLDELPQLWNVVRGEMALVGPRPLPRRDFEGYYENWHYSRHAGMPGLTCLWQVSGRSNLNFESMCILDIYYLRNRNWILDIQIILRTLEVILFARGAY